MATCECAVDGNESGTTYLTGVASKMTYNTDKNVKTWSSKDYLSHLVNSRDCLLKSEVVKFVIDAWLRHRCEVEV